MSKKLILTPNAYKAGKVYAVKPINGTGDFDFVRNTGRTRVNVNGNIEELSNNIVALDYQNGCPEILLEPQRTNLYLNSDVLATQDVSTNAQSYAVSFNGTGTITFSGSFTGSLTGNGNDKVSLVFEATSGTLTSTVTGNVLNAQIEDVQIGDAIGESTSIIPTPSSTATRNKDILSKDLTPILQPTYTAFLEVVGDEGRLKIEDNLTGIEVPLNGSGKIAIQVGSQIKIIFPDNGQPKTELIYDKPDDLRNIDIVSKLAATRIGVIAIEDGIQDVSNWISGNVTSYFIETDWSAETSLNSKFKEQDWDYFPAIDLSSAPFLFKTWQDNNLKSFPSIDLSGSSLFDSAWRNNSLIIFPPNMFDTNTASNYKFVFQNNNLNQQSVDNILISVNTSAQDNNITNGDLGINQGTNATPSQAGKDAADALFAKGWTVNLNGYTPS